MTKKKGKERKGKERKRKERKERKGLRRGITPPGSHSPQTLAPPSGTRRGSIVGVGGHSRRPSWITAVRY